MARQEMARFLRQRREDLGPADVGLPAGGRRRAPGLRREEVARLAGLSVDYLARLEQGRAANPSPSVLAPLARALRLTDDERDHLYVLAGHQAPSGRLAGDHVRPGLMHLLDALPATPAQILGDLGDLLAQNEMARFLFGEVCSEREESRNVVMRWFTDPRVRAAHPQDEHEYLSRVHVADLRAAVARRGDDAGATGFVRRLRAASAEFATLWDRHEVAVRRRSLMRVLHPQIGLIELDSETLLTPAEDQRVLVFTPPPGSGTAEKLSLLRVIGDQDLTTTGD
jgi:transcriptional regulator with XRE-family HTH domain